MKPSWLIAAACLALPALAHGQDLYTLSGQVIDTEKEPLAAGEVFLLKEQDSSVLKSASILRGAFVFEPLVKGEYLLKVTSAGFKDKLQLLTLDETKSVVVSMEHAVGLLQEVTVTGAKKAIAIRNGNVLVNVEGSPLAAVPDALSLLSKLPSVQVSPDGSLISVIGSGQPLIYIDNQKMTIEDLLSLSVADIKNIEILHNPSSRYEADGRSVIVVTRKHNTKEGWKSEIGETAAYRRYYLNRSMANLSVRRKKLELKGSMQYNQLKTWEGNAFDFQIANRSIDSRYSVTAVTTRPQFIGEAGAFYQINDGDYVSLSANARSQNESFPIYTQSSLQDATHRESVATSTFNRNPNRYYTSRLNYNKKLSDGSLFVGAQQTGYNRDLHTDIYNNYNNTVTGLSQRRRQLSTIRVLAGRIDYDKTFAGGYKWESGASATHARSGGFTDISNNAPDNMQHAVFGYNEKNFAAYTTLSGKWKKLGYSAGLRMENTVSRSDYNDNVSSPSSLSRKSARLFPKASVNIPLDSAASINLRYGRSIIRPDYSSANQTAVYINPYFEWANNINVGPSETDEMAATFQFREYSVVLSLYQTRGPVYDYFDYNSDRGILRRTEINYDREYGAQLTFNVPFRYRIWTSTNVMNAVLNTIRDSNAVAGKSRPFLYCYSSNEFRLPKNFTFSLSGWAMTKSYQGVYERNALFAVDTAITKTFFKNLNCSVRFNNMFRSLNNNTQKFAINDVAANGVFYDNTREFSVAVKYSMGKLKESRYQNKDVDENGSRVR